MKKLMSAILGILIVVGILHAPKFPDYYVKAWLATGRVTYKIFGTDILGKDFIDNPHASCVFIEKNRCFTNAHLFADKPKGIIIVQLEHEDGIFTSTAEIDYWDGLFDLVILKTEKEIPAEPVKLADDYTIGEDVIFGGYGSFPFPKLRFGKLTYHEKYGLYVDDIYYGDSGAGIFNLKGELLGILYALWEWDKGQKKPSTMRGYAIPLEILREYLKS